MHWNACQTRSLSLRSSLAGLLLGLAYVLGCGGEMGPPPPPPPPTGVASNGGDGQTAAAGSPVATPPSVLVTSAQGPLSGVTVTFAVTSGGGSVTGASVTSNSNGIAAVGSWTLGSVAGSNAITATVTGLPPVSFTAQGVAGPARSVQETGGNNQTGTVGQPVSVVPSVRVNDQFGNPVGGAVVMFAVTSGGGSLTGANATTNSAGAATVGSWTLGPNPGPNTMTATVDLPNITGNPITFTATGNPAAPASIVINAGNNQGAPDGTAVPVPPSVLVRDQSSAPIAGVTVDFVVTMGGGAVTGASAVTDASGIAQLGSWTINAGTNLLEATAQGAGITGNPRTFVATGLDPARFDIEVRYNAGTSPTASQYQAFAAAKARWEQLVTADLADSVATLGAGQCGAGSPTLNETVEDVVIFVNLALIDGAGGILGSAGPCTLRDPGSPDQWLPTSGGMVFDTADLTTIEGLNLLEEVILHEMGHVLGFGTIWNFLGQLQNPSCPGVDAMGNCSPDNSGADTHFNGANAITSFDNVGGVAWTLGSKVPLENTQGGPGTRDGHWRESTFGSELMTGFINSGANPLSEVSVASLLDMGYTVNLGASDPYVLANPNAFRAPVPAVTLELKGDIWDVPMRIRDRNGRIRLLSPRLGRGR